MNLALNARDAMPRGGELLLEVKNVDLDETYAGEHVGATPGPNVLLAVSDTGVGMAPEIRRHAFEPFFTTKPAGEVTGRGLATVHGIVNQSGGTIGVYSEPGRGTTFKIRLPRIAGSVQEGYSPTVATGPVQGTGTILLIEDGRTTAPAGPDHPRAQRLSRARGQRPGGGAGPGERPRTARSTSCSRTS